MRAGMTAADMDAYETRKQTLLGALTGVVLEIGAGDGAGFPYLPVGIDWIGLEPNPDRCRHLARTAAAHGYHAPVITAPAERIPLGDASVDAVVSTTVLCSVADPDRVLAEVRRVLRPVVVSSRYRAAARGRFPFPSTPRAARKQAAGPVPATVFQHIDLCRRGQVEMRKTMFEEAAVREGFEVLGSGPPPRGRPTGSYSPAGAASVHLHR